jgi:D-serine deaminase-like pyridoxal phosphate-dependent protein
MMESPYALRDTSELLSPGLIIFRGVLRHNLESMITMAKGADRVRPHVKTHKMAEIIRLAESMGVRRHKCATLAEAEMVAAAGGTDVLVSYPLVGPNLKRFANLVRGYKSTTFRATVDDPDSARSLSDAASSLEKPIAVLLDLDVGMGRTGVAPGEAAAELYALVDRLPNLVADGLHAYDGHIRDTDPAEREKKTLAALEPVLALRERFLRRGLEVPRLVLGGTPTFPVHAELDEPGVECSPGTVVLHDQSYAGRFPDLPFSPAALLLTRVVSHPRAGRLCLDLGHKAVAADPTGSRALILGLEDANPVIHSEEHLVIETARDAEYPIGTTLLAVPTHICPTVALHRRADVIEDGELVARWEVTARDRFVGM